MKIDDTRAAPGWQFASDNTAGICAEAWEALHAANVGYAPSYGEDAWTERACALIRALFEHETAEVFFVFNGTAANSLSLNSGRRGRGGMSRTSALPYPAAWTSSPDRSSSDGSSSCSASASLRILR